MARAASARHPSTRAVSQIAIQRTAQGFEIVEHHALHRSRRPKASVALRAIAMFEVTKGAIVLLLGCGVFHLMHKNLDELVERVVQVLHVNAEGRLSNLFFELANHSSDRNLWVLALGTLAYASVR